MKSLPRKTIEYLNSGSVKGTRNRCLFDAACQFRDHSYSYDEASDQLVSRALLDGLTEGEADTTIRSAYAKQQREESVTAVAMVETKVTIHRPRKKLPKGMPDAVTTIFKKFFMPRMWKTN